MKRIAFFIATILCFTACNNDADIEKAPEAAPQITLTMPDAEKVSVYSTASESECMIDTIWVVAFDGTTKKWVEKISGDKIVKNGQATQLMPQLSKDVQDGWTLICIANVDPGVDTSAITTPSLLNNQFKLGAKSYKGGDFLPMYGEMIWSSTSGYACVMTRAVAKVQVQMGTGVSDVTTNFNAENVTYTIYNSGYTGDVRPGSTVLGTSHTASHSTVSFNLLQKNNASEAQINAYIYEYPSATKTGVNGVTVASNTFHANRQHLILEKNNTSLGINNTYYRLDFYDSSNSLYMDTERNHHYIFTINKVRSEGYGSTAEAQAKPGSNIEYTVRIEDNSQSITSNGQYAIATNVDTAKIATGGISNTIIATARVVDPTGTVTLPGGTISIETASTSPVGAIFTINLPTTLSANTGINVSTGSTFQSGVILLKLGNITHRLYVKAE